MNTGILFLIILAIAMIIVLISIIRYGNKNTAYYNNIYRNKKNKTDYDSGSYYIDSDNNCNNNEHVED